jgi:hypothetical protein
VNPEATRNATLAFTGVALALGLAVLGWDWWRTITTPRKNTREAWDGEPPPL